MHIFECYVPSYDNRNRDINTQRGVKILGVCTVLRGTLNTVKSFYYQFWMSPTKSVYSDTGFESSVSVFRVFVACGCLVLLSEVVVRTSSDVNKCTYQGLVLRHFLVCVESLSSKEGRPYGGPFLRVSGPSGTRVPRG